MPDAPAPLPAPIAPMMAQYLKIKHDNPGSLLFYRLGDFYELFFDDATAAAAALDIALTKRGKHLGADIAMCGVPVHSAERYLQQLIRKGFRVAVCEQLESPAEAKKRGAKSVVKRDVVRLVTPGTLTEDALLDARRNNFLAAWAEVRGEGALAWVDMSTGDFSVAPTLRDGLGPALARIAPRELLTIDGSDNSAALSALAEDIGAATTPLGRSSFDSASAKARLQTLFKVRTLDGFGAFSRADLAALGAIVDYIELTQCGQTPLIKPPVREAAGGTMRIDAATRRNLELTRTLSGVREGSLLHAIDRTVTGAGARLLERRLASPSTDPDLIRARLDAVQFFVEDLAFSEETRDLLRRTPEIERALSRLALDRGGPRDLAALRDGLRQAGALQMRLEALAPGALPVRIARAAADLGGHADLVDHFERALAPDPPALLRDGGFIAAGFNAVLDETRALRDQGRQVIRDHEGKYKTETQIASLRIKHNNVLGYFIEVTATHAEKMMRPPLSESFIHRQTLANAARFTTIELTELETRIIHAGEQTLETEKRIFAELRAAALDKAPQIAATALALARIDVAGALGRLAAEEGWTRPEIDHSRAFAITGGRHPVVEFALRRVGEAPFVANDCDLSAERIGGEEDDDDGEAHPLWLLTGPNMAGKSTFLRQNALIALLAQSGAFVPAHSARIGVVDQLFSRVGAADDLARGRSTFMVEMIETAAILNQAGERALVILDEIGRGTATYDGLSIAWATIEHLHDVNRCRTLFATHYHELTALNERLAGLRNTTVRVREWEGEVVFLHEVAPGAADRSYGVQVARLAGLPLRVTGRAREVLDALEQRDGGGRRTQTLIDDLPLFSAAPASAAPSASPSKLERKLADLAPDQMTPLEAMEALYALKILAES